MLRLIADFPDNGALLGGEGSDAAGYSARVGKGDAQALTLRLKLQRLDGLYRTCGAFRRSNQATLATARSNSRSCSPGYADFR